MNRKVLATNLIFPEALKWHNNLLWFSDMHDLCIKTLDLNNPNQIEDIVKIPQRPSGLGWLPDDSLLIASMLDKKIMRWDSASLTTFADLTPYEPIAINDLITSSAGITYVGGFGFDLYNNSTPRNTNLNMVSKDGIVSIAARDLNFPNGMAITPDNQSLIVAETFAGRLIKFDILKDGSLLNRKTIIEIKDMTPDGISLDKSSHIWVCSPLTKSILKISLTGKVLQEIIYDNGYMPFSCTIGGQNKNQLFVALAESFDPSVTVKKKSAYIESIEIESL